MKFGIKRKILFMNICVLIIAIVGIYVVTIYELYTRITNNSIEMLKKESYSSQAFVMEYLQNENKDDIEKVLNDMSPFISSYLSSKSKVRVQMYNKTSIIGDSENYPTIKRDSDVNEALMGKKAYIIRKISGQYYVLFSSPIYNKEDQIGCIRYVYNLKNENKIILDTVISMTFFTIISVLISIFMSNSFSNEIVKPIVMLRKLARQVSLGDFSKRFKISSNDEIEDLAESFNIMSNNIENMIAKLKEEKENQKRFLDNITHEFKTPVAAVMGYSDLLFRVKDEKDTKECIKYIKKSSDRLLNLVEQLLELSVLNKNQFELNTETTDIKPIVENAAMLLKPRMSKFGIDIDINIESKDIIADIKKTEQVILNVLDNAIKYSECDKILINMDYDEEFVKLYIKDNGQGIPEKDLKKVFEHFYTAHKSLQNKHGGSGLGLAICKEIMTKQFGDIEMQNEDGAKVILTFKTDFDM